MDFKGLFISLSVSALLVFAIMNFVITTQVDNNPQNLITNNSVINETYGELYNKISESQGSGDTAYQSFTNATPTQSFGVLDIVGVVSPTRIFSTVGIGFYNTIIKLPASFLGVPEEVMAMIDSILLVLIIIGAWAVWKGVVS